MTTLEQLHKVIEHISDGYVPDDISNDDKMAGLLALLMGDIHLSEPENINFIYIGDNSTEAQKRFIAECRFDELDYTITGTSVRIMIDDVQRIVWFSSYGGTGAFRGTTEKFARVYVNLTENPKDVQLVNTNVLPAVASMEDWVAV